jgi:hypothetical protein
MRTEQQELHRLYDKHEMGPEIYRRNESHPYSIYRALMQCPCGDWFVHNTQANTWEPLFGYVAADFINSNPELYPMLKAYWQNMPPLAPENNAASWDDVNCRVDQDIRSFHSKAAISSKPLGSEQGSDKDLIPPAVPIQDYNYKDPSPGVWTSISTSSTIDKES